MKLEHAIDYVKSKEEKRKLRMDRLVPYFIVASIIAAVVLVHHLNV